MARFSILFPAGDAATGADAAPDCLSDLHLDEIITAINAGHADDVDRYFRQPLPDVAAIEHRHQVFRDLQDERIRQPITDFVNGLRTMRHRREQARELRHPLQRQGWFIYAVQTYCETVATLRQALGRVAPTSRGLSEFCSYLTEYVDSDTFQSLLADTSTVRAALHDVRYTVHIQDRRVHVEKYSGQTDYSPDAVATFERFATEEAIDYHVTHRDSADMNHVERQILECVAKLYPNAFKQLAEFCRRNTGFTESTVIRFDHEIRFYLYYLTFVRRMSAAGLRFSYPEVTAEPGVLAADDAVDLALAIKSDHPLVGNDFRFSEAERVLVITGPNQGGKTTFARTIGQCAYLASLGCPVPAVHARFTVPDTIYTHFERQESLTTLHGKLEDELVRIHEILSSATATSLVILNESFASTTLNDALLIATKVVRRIVGIRCTAVYVSFLDQLASVDRACVSMVGEVAPDDPARRTFKFTRRPADGLAYAAALANKYGLTHQALRQRIGR